MDDPNIKKGDPFNVKNAEVVASLGKATSGDDASSTAAAEDVDDMSGDIEIGTVDDADEYSIDQSCADVGADDDLQKVFRRPSVRRLLLAHPSRQGQRVEACLDD